MNKQILSVLALTLAFGTYAMAEEAAPAPATHEAGAAPAEGAAAPAKGVKKNKKGTTTKKEKHSKKHAE
ncbi:hypothetical protein K2X30_15260 [bacterium]|nr:hypothetical protein [bacterium]